MPVEVGARMQYIQDVFLGIQDYMQQRHDLEELIAYLDNEPPEFRSVAFESASMELGLLDLINGSELTEWNAFYARSPKAHAVHIGIGLGWAFAKKDRIHSSAWPPVPPMMRWMLYDGMGYYHGLFKGRRTVKDRSIPAGIEGQDVRGYDQGLGRRLWYNTFGEVQKVAALINTFPSARQPDLWRGVGIACGYVGGTQQTGLELLSVFAAQYKQQLCIGIVLAAMNRIASDSVNESIEAACRVICDMTLDEIPELEVIMTGDPDTVKSVAWLRHLESCLTSH